MTRSTEHWGRCNEVLKEAVGFLNEHQPIDASVLVTVRADDLRLLLVESLDLDRLIERDTTPKQALQQIAQILRDLGLPWEHWNWEKGEPPP